MSASFLLSATAALFAASALAMPSPVQDQPSPVYHGRGLITDAAQAGADSDFAGAFYQAPGTFTSVSATFTIVQPSVPTGYPASDNYYFSLWAGLGRTTNCHQQGGYAAHEGLLQTGCDLNTKNDLNGHAFQCWVEYFPNAAVYIDMYPSVGHSIAVGVKALSPTVGVVSIENLDSGVSFKTTMTAPHPSNTIIGQGNIAEFALETTPTPTIPAFKPAVSFTNAMIYNAAGSLVPLPSGDSEVQRNGVDETRSSNTAHGVLIQYVKS